MKIIFPQELYDIIGSYSFHEIKIDGDDLKVIELPCKYFVIDYTDDGVIVYPCRVS